MNINHDAALIAKFVQGQTSFVASQDLKIELAFDSTQLLTRRGGLIASLRQEDNLPTVVVRRGCDYWNLLHYTLLKQGFVPLLSAGTDKVFARYQKREVPPGYKINATDASTLWKEWWMNSRSGNRDRIELDVLLFTRSQWVAIRDITCKQGVFFIKTLGPEVVRQASEPVVWLNRISHACLDSSLRQPQSTEPTAAPTPSVSASSSAQGWPPQPPHPKPLAAQGMASVASGYKTGEPEPGMSGMAQAELAPDLRQVVRVHQGKLYVTTPLGEIIVEGTNLKFQLNAVQPALSNAFLQRSQEVEVQPQSVAIGF